MIHSGQTYYSIEFKEEDGKIYVLFYGPDDNLVAKREIPHQDINDAIRLNGENS
jgi:hypothetical protein